MAKKRAKRDKDGYLRKVDNKMRIFGETDTDKKVIRINKSKKKNKRKGEVIDTITHEERHRKSPRMHEKTVRQMVKKELKKMSKKQKQKLYNRYV